MEETTKEQIGQRLSVIALFTRNHLTNSITGRFLTCYVSAFEHHGELTTERTVFIGKWR